MHIWQKRMRRKFPNFNTVIEYEICFESSVGKEQIPGHLG